MAALLAASPCTTSSTRACVTEAARRKSGSVLGALAAWLGYVVVRALASTYRFRFHGSPGIPTPAGRTGYILAIWHQNLFAGILAQTGHRHVVIVSRSRDGEPVSDAVIAAAKAPKSS